MIAYFRFTKSTDGVEWVGERFDGETFYLPVHYDHAPLAKYFEFKCIALEYLFPIESVPMVCRLPDRIEKKVGFVYKQTDHFKRDVEQSLILFTHYKQFLQ